MCGPWESALGRRGAGGRPGPGLVLRRAGKGVCGSPRSWGVREEDMCGSGAVGVILAGFSPLSF